MAKQKTLFSRVIRKVKQDAGSAWTKQCIDALQLFNKPPKTLPEEALALQGEDFIHTLQLEAILRTIDEELIGKGDTDPFIYPGLMVAWESLPTTVEIESTAVAFAQNNMPAILGTSLERVRRLFPSCMLCDIRAFGLHPYRDDYEALFIYPSYDREREYPVLLALAISLKRGLGFPLESKIVLRGETFLDALDASIAERDLLEKQCWAGLDKGDHDYIFSPIEDEPEVCDLAALVLALMCSDFAKVEVLPSSRERRLMVKLAEDGDTADVAAGPEIAVEPANRAASSDEDDGEKTVIAEDAAESEAPMVKLCGGSDEASFENKGAAILGSEDAKRPTTHANDAFNDAVDHPLADDDSLDDEAVAAAEASTEETSSESGSSDAQDAALSPVVSDADDDNAADTLAFIAELQEQVAYLEAALADQERKSSSLEYHLGQAQAAANQAKSEAAALRKRAELAESMDIPTTPLEALELAERAFGDRLIFMDQARRSAEEFTKGSPREVWAVLRSMAVVLHPLIFGKAGGNIIHAFEAQSGFEITFREMKMIKSASTYSKLRTVTTDNGEQKEAMAHVKGKGTKKGESLRVHFFADYAAKALIIAHCGEHLQTYDTSSL